MHTLKVCSSVPDLALIDHWGTLAPKIKNLVKFAEDNYGSVLCRTNIQVTRCRQAETLMKVVT